MTSPGDPDTPPVGDPPPTVPERTARPEPRSGPRTPVLLATLILYGALALWNAPRRDFWGGEAGHALVSREMEESFSTRTGWLIPTLGEETYLAKPPLSYWLPALTHLLTGLDPRLSYRVPAVLFALLGLWLTFRLGRALLDARIAFLALVVQATTWLFFIESAWLGSDLQFAVFCQLSLTGFVLADSKSGSRLWKVMGWMGLAGAALTKSLPLAAFLVFGVLLFYFFFHGGVTAVKQGFQRGWSKGGVLLFLLLAAPWYVAAGLLNGSELLEEHLFAQHIERLVNAVSEARSPYFYLLALPVAFLPWTLFVPLGLYHGKDRMSRRGQRLATTWTIFVLVALSLISSKRATFLLPLWPALSLLISAAFFETEAKFSVWEDYLGPGLFKVVPYLLKAPAIAALIVTISWFFDLHHRVLDETLAEELNEPSRVLPLLAMAILGGVAAWWTSLRVEKLLKAKELPRAAFETACATLFFFFIATFVRPALNTVYSAAPFLVEHVQKEVKEAQLASYGKLRPPEILYFLERPVRHFSELIVEAEQGSEEDARRQELEQYLRNTERVYLITSAAELKRLKNHFPAIYSTEPKSLLYETGTRGRMGSPGEYVLLSNRAR